MTADDIVVVGAVNVDMVVTAPQLPGPGETVVGPGMRRHGGGKGANAAVAAARSGGTVHYVGAVGDDDLGATALRELEADGVGTDDVAVVAQEATGVALIVVDEAGENQIAVGAGANGRLGADVVEAALRRRLPTAGCVLVSTEVPGAAVAAAVRAATAAGVRCVLNPAPVIPVVVELLDLGPVLTPNTGELFALAAAAGSGPPPSRASPSCKEILTCAQALVGRTRAPVLVTLGGDGVLVVDSDGTSRHVAPLWVEVRDTTGAGDTFNGVLARELAAGRRLDEAARVATVAAGLSVTAVGARNGMPTATELAAAAAGA
ncbi:ribokinase [Pseudonocardia sulfidoxydans NBRC 16205]|uniref:Ribokinase n=1 Tax=Pseudonocardia sulfidoxydans NBRC 16205 TaxID=1223511 RepID=A0A511DHL7_9PSEU|nr:PfkB family carbohydrate kinase [Pseudonocardia sulfidoxydans]GEL24279.1 ribokinase [Pseudonocardia sulfidoxydans NBRC 16205]